MTSWKRKKLNKTRVSTEMGDRRLQMEGTAHGKVLRWEPVRQVWGAAKGLFAQSVEYRIMESASKAGKSEAVATGETVAMNGSDCEFESWVCY